MNTCAILSCIKIARGQTWVKQKKYFLEIHHSYIDVMFLASEVNLVVVGVLYAEMDWFYMCMAVWV